ncbi:hypothetical protein SLEP1_g3086 [Rubroshorea leprosula]|uniref:DNA annealing helicase and endonuclease ZRANB3 n=1 Tax=Rubroshorea leprosula TaxID=152421 RepID=A0AAV5HQN9_9ROSI|nr:hypothetical protein SLEP1_g3086 [Rubroshorea leprosula]
MTLTEEQRKQAEANRLAAIEKLKRKALSESTSSGILYQQNYHQWRLSKYPRLENDRTHFTTIPQDSSFNPVSTTHSQGKFRVWLEICSPDSFSVRPDVLEGFPYPGDEECFRRLNDVLSNVVPSHYTQNHEGGKAGVYKLMDYDAVNSCLQKSKCIQIENIPHTTIRVVEKLSHSFVSRRWEPCRPEHLCDDLVDELIGRLPIFLFDALLPFQLDGVRFGLRRGGRCLIADEMGLGKTLQAIAIAGCFMNEGSILVVCPAILRYSWAEELERWLPSCLPSDIHLVFGHRDNPAYLKRCPRVVVISYTMLSRLRKTMLEQNWAVLIVDESHHLRCSKKPSEPDEIQSVLDVARKINHIVLLSGTPSLSRPYDIFHQINMLWPGLLGKDKYKFANTYCAVNMVQNTPGFKDFSKGVRLEELNVLLKQTVMIRRLKEQVLVQLPPKRRQIIRLLLKRSDIASAKASISLISADASENNAAQAIHSEKFEENDDGGGCNEELCFQELGIAKLPGFREWLSIHPIIEKSDAGEEVDSNTRSLKMIIFAHHHKVLDGIQEFICEKGIGFVRIDGTTLPKDRQTAVLSFQSSNQVKIAIVGITAGGVGLNFSSAQNVVFLELPQSPSLMLQAEDRAHRRGQKSAVNVYIFCAKDTIDESHWQNLNKSLSHVSSTTNGKYDAIREIAVEGVSYLETDRSSDDQILGKAAYDKPFVEFVKLPGSEVADKAAQMNDGTAEQSQTGGRDLHNIGHSFQPKASEKDNGMLVQQPEDDCFTNQVDSLRFEVSRYTGRIHLYSCIRGTDSRPTPLFENFRPEELESANFPTADSKKPVSNLFKNDSAYRHALKAFITEWHKLRPIEQRKLLRKPLQLPLSVELCYLQESSNHNRGGLLKGGSKRRTTPLYEISLPLPKNSVWKKVQLCSGYCKKEKEYTQAWSLANEPLCKFCQKPCKGANAETPEYFEDLFCDLECYEEYRLRTSNRFLRQELFQVEHGICTNCQLDCHQLVKNLKPLSLQRRLEYIKKIAPKIASQKKLVNKLVNDPSEGNAWHADHVVPVYKGGGECRLENMRTLCVACHKDVTAAQNAERRTMRIKTKKKLEAIMSDLKNDEKMEKNSASVKDEGPSSISEDINDDELLVKVPGSSYCGRESPGTQSEGLNSLKLE